MKSFKVKLLSALKVDKETNAGLVSDIKQELRKANALKVMYIANTKKLRINKILNFIIKAS